MEQTNEKEGVVAEVTTTEQPQAVVDTQSTQPQPTFTPDQVKQMVKEAVQEESQKTVKWFQKNLSKKDNEILALRKQATNSDPDTLDAIIRATKSGDEEALAKAEKAIAGMRLRQQEAKQQEYQQGVIEQNRKKFDEMIERSGLDAEDPRLVPFDVAFDRATDVGLEGFVKAESVLNKILRGVKPVEAPKAVETPKVDIEAEIKKRVDEGVKQALIQRGLLKTDGGAVTGVSTGGRKPTLEELRATPALEFEKKVKSGEWKL